MWIVEIIKLIGTISGTCKTFFGKYDKDIIYINVNNKLLGEDKRSIEEKIGLVGKKVVKISSLNDKHMKLHLLRMQYVWKRINWSQKYSKSIYYTGCVSVPLSVYDGYMASDKSNVSFLENNKLNNEKYLIVPDFKLVSLGVKRGARI